MTPASGVLVGDKMTFEEDLLRACCIDCVASLCYLILFVKGCVPLA
jgi:hypothetical protein